jgi:hypothetical protein
MVFAVKISGRKINAVTPVFFNSRGVKIEMIYTSLVNSMVNHRIVIAVSVIHSQNIVRVVYPMTVSHKFVCSLSGRETADFSFPAVFNAPHWNTWSLPPIEIAYYIYRMGSEIGIVKNCCVVCSDMTCEH